MTNEVSNVDILVLSTVADNAVEHFQEEETVVISQMEAAVEVVPLQDTPAFEAEGAADEEVEDETIWIQVSPEATGDAPIEISVHEEIEESDSVVEVQQDGVEQAPEEASEELLAKFNSVTLADALHLIEHVPFSFAQAVEAFTLACRVGTFLSQREWNEERRETYFTGVFEQLYVYMFALIKACQNSMSIRKKSEIQQSIYRLYVIYRAVSKEIAAHDSMLWEDLFVGMYPDIDFVGPPAFEDVAPIFVSSFSCVFDQDRRYVFGKAFNKKIKELCEEEFDMFGCFSDIDTIEKIANIDATRVLNFVAQYSFITENTKIEFKTRSQTLNIMARMFL